MSLHRPGPSYVHPVPRQDCECGAQFEGETREDAVLKYRAHREVATRPEKQVGRAGVARARQALVEKRAELGGAA